jgi:ribosomal protein S18 acetylase RimI-like enzyme
MTLDDCSEVARIHTESWRFAYRGIIDQAFLNQIDVNKREENWRRGIEANDPNIIRLVVVDNNAVLGFAVGGENRTKDLAPQAEAELWAIYTDPNQMRSGTGSKLLQAFSQHLHSLNLKSFCVWALEDNHIARNFYQKNGGVQLKQLNHIQIGAQNLVEVGFEFHLLKR